MIFRMLVAFAAALWFTSASAQAPQAEQRLPAVTVTATQEGGSGPIKVDEAEVTRSGASILDTPRTVSVIPAATADDQAAYTVGEVMRNVAGVRPVTYVGTYDALYARGFWLQTTTNFLRNGSRFAHLVQPPRHNVERYEFIKGPASLDYGRVEPGGLLNIVTKRPQAEPWREVMAGVGQHGYREAAFDLAGSLNESKTVLYRLNGGTIREPFATDAVDPRQHDIAGALQVAVSTRTKLYFDFEYSERDQLTYPGLPVPDPRDPTSADRLRDKFYGEPEGTFEGKHQFFSVRLDYRFSDAWSGTVGYSNNQMSRDPRNVYLSGVSGNLVDRFPYTGDQHFDVQTLQYDLKGDLQLAGMRHRLTVGADTLTSKEHGAFPFNTPPLPSVDLNNPQPTGGAALLAPYDTPFKGKFEDYGVTVQDLVTVNRYLEVLAGARYSYYDETPTDYSGTNAVVEKQHGDSVDPTLGVVLKPVPSASLYASYSSSFAPNIGVFLGPGQYAPPSEAKQYEIGAKAEWFERRLRTSVAYFDLTKTNVPTVSLTNPAFSEVSGEVNSTGWEFEVVGQVARGWNVLAGYALIDAEITQDNTPENVGMVPAFTPRHSGSLWTTYTSGDWTVGTGLFYTGAKYVNNTNEARLPSFTVVDAMLAYTFRSGLPGARLQFNLRNVFDETYYEAGTATGPDFTDVYPGLPRSLSASLSVPF